MPPSLCSLSFYLIVLRHTLPNPPQNLAKCCVRSFHTHFFLPRQSLPFLPRQIAGMRSDCVCLCVRQRESIWTGMCGGCCFVYVDFSDVIMTPCKKSIRCRKMLLAGGRGAEPCVFVHDCLGECQPLSPTSLLSHCIFVESKRVYVSNLVFLP